MSGIFSLSKARKDRARAAAKSQADANAAKHGRTKAERAQDAARVEATRRALDLVKREPE